MARPRQLSPLKALQLLTEERNPRRPRTQASEDATRGYLAAARSLSLVEGIRRSSVNAYALPRGIEIGQELDVIGILTATDRLGPDGGPPEPSERPTTSGIWRLETGAPLPADTEGLLPIDAAVVVGTHRVRVLRLPQEGWGIVTRALEPTVPRPSELPPQESIDADTVSTFRPGTRCDDRVRALLLAAGIEALELGPRLRVGFAALGDELVDLGTVLSTGTATELGASPRHDLTTYWLGEALKRLGVEAVPLGILPDEPRLLAKRIFHASERKLDLLLLVGGLGNGVTDRTTEALRREGARILFHRVQLDGCTNVLFAKTLGLEVIGLSGKPLEAAAGFDLFVRPAVLARLGASDSLWDWSRFTWPLAGQEPPPASCESADTTLWSARPATLMPQPGHGGCVHYWTAPSFELPTVPNQDGWALVGTANVPDSTPQRAYYQPLDQHQHNK